MRRFFRRHRLINGRSAHSLSLIDAMCRVVVLLLLLLLVYVSSSSAALQEQDEEAMMASHLRGAQGGMAEVVFALDRSGSVGAANFEVEKGFVESFLTHVVVDVNATRVAVLSYSDTAVVHVDLLRSPGNKCALSQALQEVRYIDSRATNIVAALEAASTIFENARPGVHKVLLLLSDGVATAGGPPGAAAGRLRAKGVEVWCLGVGREARGELLALATSPQHVYSCDTFTDFRRLAQRIRGDPHEVSWSSDGGSVGLCRHLCSPYGGEGEDPGCCDPGARCSCALLSGTHACVCGTGHFGLSGLPGHCTPCPLGSYKSRVEPSTSCSACPRGSTTRQTGSTSLANCVCVEGHQGEPAKGEECMRVRCPPLQAPPNGFLLGECVPLFGSECVFGCEEGYELANPHDDIRTCRANGTWSGDNARCQRIECRRPPGSSGGGGLRVRCTHHHHRYFEGTRCSFSCGLGHLMQGSAERECLPSKRWSGTEPVCIPVECEVPPPLPRHGSSTCPPGVRPKFRETCAFRCMPGFRLHGPAFLHCDADGRLRPFDPRLFDQTPTCQDVEPPELQCPSSRALATEEGREGAHVSWSGPFASDNGGQEPILHAPGHLPLYLAIGTHTLQYVATDQAGLSTTCTFTVRIIDEEPPRVLRCPSTVSVVTDELTAQVFWEEPLFQDNSRKTIAIEQSRRPGDSFSPGLETVTYRAYDESRNLAECSFDVIVSRSSCPYFPGPANGALACDDLLFGSFCEVMCEENFDFAPHPPAHLYVCTADAKWSTDPPDMPLPWPDCTRPVFPGGVRLMASGFYYSGDCSDPQTQVQIRKQFVGRLLQRQPKAHACFQRGACSLDSVRVLCGKRTTTPAAGKRRIRRDLLLFGGGGEDIEVEFEITLHPDHQGELNDTEAVLQSFLDSIRHLQWDDEDAMTTTTPSSPSAAAAEVVVITEVLCRPGSVLTNHDSCMLCPSGTFFLVVEGSSECVDCPSGSFQPLEGQTECELCPNGTSTEHPRAKNDTDCKGICPPGTYSGSGLQTCLACPLGTFQESGGQGECRPCPPGTTTPHVQATSPSDCRELCAPGSRSESGLRPCALCPRGFFQPSPGQRECFECPRNLSTPSTGATDHAVCQADVDPCAGEEEEVCHHGGTCLREEGGRSATCVCPAGFEGPTCQLDVDECERHQPCLNAATQCINTVGSFYCNCSEGFSGALCQEEIDECLSSPCRNNGTCLDKVNGFVCACSAGFGGERCELELCGPLGVVCQGGGRCDEGGACDCPQGRQGLDCSYDPDDCEGIVCHNNGTCVDGLASFECVCVAGYSGALCETELDDCVDNGCSEGATCRDLLADYECLCPPGHAGRFCETRPSPDFVLHFAGGDLSSLASASVRAAPLASVTASAWVQTLSGGAAALSYAVAPAMDNALALTDCGALTVHLGNQPRLTDVAVDDGRWHHLAFAWQPSGDWRLYKDGELAANGSHLMPPGGKVWGGGTLLIGQEQDTPGGGFSPLESFQGNISRVNVWDRYLSASDVASLCRMEEKAIPGRVVAWPDFLPGVRGQVALIDNALPAIGDTRMDTKTGHDIT